MKNLTSFVALSVAVLLSGPVAFSQAGAVGTESAAAQPWKKIPVPPLHAFKPVQPKRIELANGLVIFLQEDHELPFVNGTILIRGGARDEPAELQAPEWCGVSSRSA